MRTVKTTKIIHEAGYAAEVPIDLIEDDHPWAPYLSLHDVRKLESVREALKTGDLKAAAALARVYALTPVAAE